MKVKPFMAVMPGDNNSARKVASVPYDTVDAAEARVLAKDNPSSFLHVVRPEIDFPEGTDPYSEAVYQRASDNFEVLIRKGLLVEDRVESFFVYRQKMGNHVQDGIVACCHVSDYEEGKIKKHEKTRADKEDDRTRHILAVGANTGPVFLAYRDEKAIDAVVAEATKEKPLFDFTAPEGVGHTVWRAGNEGKRLAELFAKVPALYIADGHHRAAASARAALEKRKNNPGHIGNEEYNWFMAVLFPASRLKIMPYNRCVHDLNRLSPQEFLGKVKEIFGCVETGKPSPGAGRHAAMYLAGRWYDLSWTVDTGAGVVGRIDVSILQDRLLGPVLGIGDPRKDKRIDFVGGIRGTAELVKRVDSGRDAVAFSMYPVTVEEVMAVSDAGLIMPPKSTWFEPKLRSGLLCHRL